MLENQSDTPPANKGQAKKVIWRQNQQFKKELATTCKIKDLCQSCAYINLDYQQGLESKYQDNISLLKKVSSLDGIGIIPPKPPPRSLGYRAHAKLAVRPSSHSTKRFAIGMFQPKTHKVINVSQCPVHKESINLAIRDLSEELEKSDLSPYDEDNHTGDLRFIAIRASHLTNELMLTFVVRRDGLKKEMQQLISILRQKGHIISSAHINLNTEKKNVIFGDLSKRIAGTDRLRERLCNLDFEIGPTSFFQVNPWQAELIYRRIQQLAGPDFSQSVAWDLYCGTGQISILLAGNGYRTLGIEENPQACRDGQKNINRNHIENQPTFIAAKVEELAYHLPAWASEPQLIVANPSRHGLSADALNLVAQTIHKTNCRFLYLSCEMESFAENLAYLTQNTSVRLRQLECFDMFAYTNKLEWLGIFG